MPYGGGELRRQRKCFHMYVTEDRWRKHKESFSWSALLLSEFKQPVSAHYSHYGLIIYMKGNTFFSLFFAVNLNTLSLSGHETARVGREGSSTMDLAAAEENRQWGIPHHVWSELTLLLFLPDSSLLVWVQRKKVNSFPGTLNVCFGCLFSVHSSS